MSVKFVLKLLLALTAAVFLPLGYEVQLDHHSEAERSQWRWAGLPVTDWQVRENASFRWVRDVLNLPPDYFIRRTGPFWLGTHIGALSRNSREVTVFREVWEKAPAEEKPTVRVEARQCLMEPDWRAREQMVAEVVKRRGRA